MVDRAVLLAVLERARTEGFLGPGPVAPHLAHALGFAEVIGSPPSGLALDLGSGGGLPGLPLALKWPSSRWVLLDSQRRRSGFLARSVEELGLGDRVQVATARAEEFVDSDRRGGFDLVVARSFGRPAVVAECAAPFLMAGFGRLVVSEPPEAPPDRWDPAGLAQLGMGLGPTLRAAGASFQVVTQVAACPERFPRRTGRASSRPLF